MPRKKAKSPAEEATSESQDQPRYPKPRIMLIDLDEGVASGLQKLGYNVVTGTFGHPYEVPMSDGRLSVIVDARLPSFEEQEIVVIDLFPPETMAGPPGEKHVSEGELDFWASCSRGKIDPRPVIMSQVRDSFDRILNHGGFFVVFAMPRIKQNLIWGRIGPRGGLIIKDKLDFDNWCFLSTLSSDHLKVKSSQGTEITMARKDAPIYATLNRYLRELHYFCTFDQDWRLDEKRWLPLGVNKYGQTVSALLGPYEGKGGMLIVPQTTDKPGFIRNLLEEAIPELCPHLFPHIEGVRWVERPEYELVSVLDLKDEKERARRETEQRLAELDRQIEEERSELAFLHDILRTSGDDLVKAVAKCLHFIGFQNVVDVDQLKAETGDTSPKQEDLQILDQSPTILVEVKGLSGLPKEADSLQVVKYIGRRMKEWDRTDVHGLSVINHQRNLPGLDRQDEKVFTQQQVDDAIQNGFGLLTTWDLFLLIRGMIRHEWNPIHLRSLFYRTGRIGRLPAHYQPLGKVFHYWEKPRVVGIEIVDRPLRQGERVGFVLHGGFEEQVAESIQVDNKPVEVAQPGQSIGLKTPFGRRVLRNGTLVCLVTEDLQTT